jgi:hypothetical protein
MPQRRRNHPRTQRHSWNKGKQTLLPGASTVSPGHTARTQNSHCCTAQECTRWLLRTWSLQGRSTPRSTAPCRRRRSGRSWRRRYQRDSHCKPPRQTCCTAPGGIWPPWSSQIQWGTHTLPCTTQSMRRSSNPGKPRTGLRHTGCTTLTRPGCRCPPDKWPPGCSWTPRGTRSLLRTAPSRLVLCNQQSPRCQRCTGPCMRRW